MFSGHYIKVISKRIINTFTFLCVNDVNNKLQIKNGQIERDGDSLILCDGCDCLNYYDVGLLNQHQTQLYQWITANKKYLLA